MASMQRIKGFADMFAEEAALFSFMEETARRVFSSYGYGELRTPILEFTDLFSRGMGAETDVVQKEMFSFPDRKGRSMTLRPEATAGVMRAFIEAGRQEGISKYFTYGPMFRYERPQKGRMRQFHQINCECVGAEEAQADAELLLMLTAFMRELGLSGLRLEINSLGCRECRPRYREALAAFLAGLDHATLCEDCRRRLVGNPLRVLDCKVPGCKEQLRDAPSIREHVCPDCRAHFASVLSLLDAAEVAYTLQDRLVRGLDYYTRTTFELVSDSIGAQGSVAGGGRFDGLVASLGGPDAPGIGFACGMERLALLLDAPGARKPDFYFVVLDPQALDTALLLAQTLRDGGKRGEVSFSVRSLKSQMRQASRLEVKTCLLLGGDELAAGVVAVKDMQSGLQRTVPMAALINAV
jgi:histidyl-tRNA synthetase